MLGEVDLADRRDSVVDRLSGGQRSRVSLAAALVGSPSLLVLDEPTVGLDPVLRRDLWELFARLAAAGTSLLVSSHVMDEATRCDRLVLMRSGDVLADDTLAEPAGAHRRRRRRGRLPRPGRRRRDGGGGMNPRLTLASAGRVLAQLRHDHRTVALVVVLPCVLIGLLAWVFDGTPVFDRIGAQLLGVFPFVVMFLVTSVATLRERQSGTLERLMTLPVAPRRRRRSATPWPSASLAVVQAVVASLFAHLRLRARRAGPALVAGRHRGVGRAARHHPRARGELRSPRTEFQAVQLMPAIVLPQFLLCGLLVPRDDLPDVLERVSDVLPLSYAVDALDRGGADRGAVAGHRRRARRHRRVRGRRARARSRHAAAPDALSGGSGRGPDGVRAPRRLRPC